MPASLSLSDICRRCREETTRYHRGEPHDDSFCYEVFRRAVEDRDDGCWQELHAIYRDQVLSWCRRTAIGNTDLEELAALTWEKFWQNFTPAKLAVSGGSAGVLSYLKMCARSATVDIARSRAPLPSLGDSDADLADTHELPEDAHARIASTAEFWRMIDGTLRDGRERTLVYLTYELGLKPAEIQAQRPDLFPSIKDVYQGTRNILDRLRRDQSLRTWFEQERTD